jgi:GcrA cell cycle regulator
MNMNERDRLVRQAARAAPASSDLDWSEARVALLRRRWGEGASASAIARELSGGVSRSAVLGKIRRLKLARRHIKPRQERASCRQSAGRRDGALPITASSGASALRRALQALGLAPPVCGPGTPQERPGANIAFGPPCALLELGDFTCRWPVGTPGEPDFVFCGAPSLARRPYCLAHCLIAYRRDEERGAEAGESLAQCGREAA